MVSSSVTRFFSVHSDFVDSDGQVLFPARDLRLTRRVLRDYTYRNTSAEGTFRMWDYVMMMAVEVVERDGADLFAMLLQDE